jgi:hypothetical protein
VSTDLPEPAGPRRTRKQSFWQTIPGAVTIVGIVALLAVVVWAGRREQAAERAKLRVDVESCAFTGRTAVVRLAAFNGSGATRTLHIELEYRDADGARVDRDSATARNVAPGDTVRVEERTLLDVPTTAGTCEVASVR